MVAECKAAAFIYISLLTAEHHGKALSKCDQILGCIKLPMKRALSLLKEEKHVFKLCCVTVNSFIHLYFLPFASRKYNLVHFCQCFRCEYLLRVKGGEFVSQIQARFPHLLEQVNFTVL